MAYSTTSVRDRGFGARMSESCGGVCFGLILLLISCPLLWWNEGNAVAEATALDEASRVLLIAGDTIDTSLSGKLIHYSGDVTVPGKGVEDSEFGIHVPGAIRITRAVDAYQVTEHSRSITRREGSKEVTTTEYSYGQDWSRSLVPSSNFHDPSKKGSNPSTWRVPPTSLSAKEARVGPYRLPTTVIEKLGTDVDVDLTDERVSKIAKAIAGTHGSGNKMIDSGAQRLSAALVPSNTGPRGLALSSMTYHNGALYTGNALAPLIGDNRVRFTAASPETASILGMQGRGGFLEPYESSNGRRILLFSDGYKSARTLLSEAAALNNLQLMAIRGFGWLAMVIGYMMLLGPAVTLASGVPFLGSLLSGIAGCGACIAAVLAGTSTAALIVAIAWLFARPLVSVVLLVAVAGAWYLGAQRKKSE